jgi:hypothetical protein
VTATPEEPPGFLQWVTSGPTSAPVSAQDAQAAATAAAIAAQADCARNCAETAVGHKAYLIEQGFCDEHAEAIAVQLHSLLLVRWLGVFPHA